MEARDRVRHKYSPGDKVFCDTPNDQIARGVYTVIKEAKSRECLILEGKGSYRFDKIRFEPCNTPVSPPPVEHSTATEVRARMHEKQLLHAARYSSNLSPFSSTAKETQRVLEQLAFMKASFFPPVIPQEMLKDVVIPPGKIEHVQDVAAEYGFGPPLPHPDTATVAKKPGRLHSSMKDLSVWDAVAACRAASRSDGRPQTFIPLTCKPCASP